MRKTIALIAAVVIGVLLVTPFVLAINRFDWGVGLLLVAPLLVWVLMRMAKAIEHWARNEPDEILVDPDFPDD